MARAIRRAASSTSPLILTGAQVAAYAIAAGFSRRGGSAHLSGAAGPGYSQATVAVAIAKAESGWNAHAVNRSSGATGLWQIYPGGTRYLDPATNARAARRKYLIQGWSAWSAYSSGAYRAHLVEAHAITTGDVLDPGQAVPTGADPLGILPSVNEPGILGSVLTGWVGDLFRVVIPILKVGAGGAGLLVTGAALVYLGGRNVPPDVARLGKVGTRAASSVAMRTPLAPAILARSELRKAKTRAQASVLTRARSEARTRATERIRIDTRPGLDRVRVVSRSKAVADRMAVQRARGVIKREQLARLKVRTPA